MRLHRVGSVQAVRAVCPHHARLLLGDRVPRAVEEVQLLRVPRDLPCSGRNVMLHYLAGRHLAVQLVHALVAALRVEVPEDVGHVGVGGDLHVSTVQYSTVQYSTEHDRTTQHSATQ